LEFGKNPLLFGKKSTFLYHFACFWKKFFPDLENYPLSNFFPKYSKFHSRLFQKRIPWNSISGKNSKIRS